MATATASRTRTGARKASARKQAPKPTFEKFVFQPVESVEELLAECDRYIEFCDNRRAIAQDDNKKQYWNGQRSAIINFKLNGAQALLGEEEDDDGNEAEVA